MGRTERKHGSTGDLDDVIEVNYGVPEGVLVVPDVLASSVGASFLDTRPNQLRSPMMDGFGMAGSMWWASSTASTAGSAPEHVFDIMRVDIYAPS